MSSQFLLSSILIIIGVEFFLERFLDFLNLGKLSVYIPEVLKNIYDEDKYTESQKYLKRTSKLSFVSSLVSFLLLMLSFYFNLFAQLDIFVRLYTDNMVFLSLSYFGILMLVSGIINFPFSYYSVFFIEEEFGFNKTTRRVFFMDMVKSSFLSIIIGGFLFTLIILIYEYYSADFWWIACLFVSIFSVFMNMFYSSLIVPLFNKQTPLEEGDLKNAISAFSAKVDFKIDNIYVIDGSKRSSKANAYFSGLGAKKRIVLYDTLIKELSIDEIVAVLAHEVGHYKKKHSIIGLFFSLLQTGFVFYLLSLCLSYDNVSYALGVSIASFHIALLSFSILYSPISTLISLFMNMLSRKHEYEADAYAVENFSGEHLSEGLKKLSVSSLSNLCPHRAYEFFYYSHPSLLKRLNAMKNKKK